MHTKSYDTKDPMYNKPREIGEEALNKLGGHMDWGFCVHRPNSA